LDSGITSKTVVARRLYKFLIAHGIRRRQELLLLLRIVWQRLNSSVAVCRFGPCVLEETILRRYALMALAGLDRGAGIPHGWIRLGRSSHTRRGRGARNLVWLRMRWH
jgi:hypothetical protein